MELLSLLPLNPLTWLAAGQVAICLGWILRLTVRALEFRDRHADIALARQHRMEPWPWVKTNAIAKIPAKGIMAAGVLAGLAVIGAAVAFPWSTSIIGGVMIWRGLTNRRDQETDEIRLLRDALGQIIGVDDRLRPPTVETHGTHVEGGPGEMVIHPHPGWRYWEQKRQDEVEVAIEAIMPGDWELVQWFGDGLNVWQRMPDLPTLVPFYHDPDLQWFELPVGPDGVTEGLRTADLSQHPHWLIGGSTGGGKTTIGRGFATHLAHHGIDGVYCDATGVSYAFLDGRPHCSVALEYRSVEAAIHAVADEVNIRHDELRRHGTYRDPLVLMVEEAEETFDLAHSIGIKVKGAKEPQLILDLLSIGRRARKVDVHLLVFTQRPAGESIPMALRANLRGRIACGPMEQTVAQMLLGNNDWPRAVNTEDIPGRNVLRIGAWIGSTQGMWIADPTDRKQDKDDRDGAELLLPPSRKRHAHDVSRETNRADAPSPGDDSKDQTAEPVSDSSGDKWRGVPDVVGDAVVTPRAIVGVEARAADGPEDAAAVLADKRAKKAVRQARYLERAKKKILSDPTDKRHGSPIARQVGCKCAKDRPELHAVDES